MSTGSEKSTASENSRGWSVPIWVAVITGIVTVIVSFIGLIGILAGIWVDRNPTNTPPSVPVVIPYWTETVAIPNTPIPESTFVEPMIIPSQTPEGPMGVMYVVLRANQTIGKNPLHVILDARDSYFVAPDGTRFECGACTYWWSVREGGTSLFGPENTDGRLEYDFGRRGTYYVSVYVCRSGSNTECAGSGTQIVVE